jgi:PAS domain S-box-containing protein
MRDSLSRMVRLLDQLRITLATWVDRVQATLRPSEVGQRMQHSSLREHEKRQARWRATWRAGRPLLVFAVAYLVAWSYLFVAAFLGKAPPPAPLFAPGAVLLSAILLTPSRHWWRFLVAAFVIQVPILAYLHVPLWWNLLGYTPDAIGPIIAASLMRPFIALPPRFATLRDVSIYTACVGVAVAIDATIGSAVNAVFGGEAYWATWVSWYLGDVLADLVLAPAILLWLAAGFGGLRAGSRRRFVEAGLLYGGLLLLGRFVIDARVLGPDAAPALIYLPVPLLLWAAARFGPRGVATALSLLIILSIPAVANALGPFASTSDPAAAVLGHILTLRLFVLVIGVPPFFLAALMQERVAAEGALRESEARYQAVVETQTEMITRYRPDTTLTFVNDATCRSWGRSREESLDKPFLAALPEAAAARVQETIQALLAQPHPGVATTEHEAWGPDGSMRWHQWVNRTILDAEGRVIELQGIGRDITDRKRAEEALRASEARYRTVVRNLPRSAVLLFDADLRHTFADGPGLLALGLTPEGLEGHTVWEAFPGELAATLAPHYEAALAGRAVALDLEHAGQTWHVQSVPLPAAASEIAAVPARAGMVLLQDATEQRRARDELERERTRATRLGALSQEFRTLAEHSPDLIARFDPGGRLRYVNQAGVDLLGQPAERWIGRTFADMGLPPDVSAPLTQALRDVVATRAPRTFDLDIPSPEGPVDALHVRFVPELAEDGALQSVLSIATDVTALKHAEARLAEQERHFRTLVEHSPDIIARFDRQLRYSYVSPAIRRVSPLPVAEMAYIGKTNAELGWPEAVYGPAHQAIARVFQTGEAETLEEIDANSPDPARPGYFRAQILPEHADDGRVESVLTVTTDITDFKRTEQALREANARIEAAREAEERRKQIAESLRGVLEVLNSQRAPRDILQYIVRQANDVLGSAAAVIYGPAQLTDARSPQTRSEAPAAARVGDLATTLRVQAAEGLRTGGLRARPHQRLPFADSAVEQALSSARPVAVTGVDGRGSLAPEDPGVRESAATDGNATVGVGDTALVCLAGELPAPFHALLVVPIRVRDSLYGCLLLLYSQPHDFEAEEVALAQAYADQVAQAITNARLQVHLEQAAAAAERNRLAQELHDTVKQELYSAGLIAQSLPIVWQTHPARAEAALRELFATTQSAYAGLQALLLELRPTALEQLPLAEALRQLSAAMSTRAGVPVVVDVEGAAAMLEPLVPAAVKIACYRVAQEALMNATKHARAHAIRVRLRATATSGRRRLELEIADDGRGFDPRAIPAGHLGLGIMRERARSVGAHVQVQSHAGQGTVVSMTWRSGQKNSAPEEPKRAERAHPAVRVGGCPS